MYEREQKINDFFCVCLERLDHFLGVNGSCWCCCCYCDHSDNECGLIVVFKSMILFIKYDMLLNFMMLMGMFYFWIDGMKNYK